MASTRSDAAASDSESHALAASFTGLPSRAAPVEHAADAQDGSKAVFLDLAESNRSAAPSASDITAKLESKRVEHERQRALQKLAFEEQMKQLELQQEQEERELLDPNGAPVQPRSATTATTDAAAAAVDGGEVRERRRVDYANAKSMPGSRRHSGELQTADLATPAVGADGKRAVKGDGTNINSFLFDDELDADLQNSAWGGKYLQMNTDDDKFPILIRRDSYPGILSASSAALDLAPLSQTPVPRNFRSTEGRTNASEWPQFQDAQSSRPSTVDQSEGSTLDRHRAAMTQGTLLTSESLDRSRSTGAGTLPPPRSAVTATASGRNTPSVEKKEGLSKVYANADLAQATGANYVDGLADQFSNFNIDSNAFGTDPTQGAFGGYGGHDHGAFAYDGTNAYGTMGGKTGLYGVDGSAQMSETNRFAGLRLEDLQGDMLPLCKDQFGCRYLQKKLEDGNPEHRDMIFNEIFPHFAELMTDPFANYLSQRLLEYSTDEQRDALIESISGELVSISLNMHGTRAVQKMIDYLSTQRQVQSLILALNLNVVTLIKDLNGNHVIQKCLNHLPPEDNQFIYNAVATHCIEVATHRHGCCVLQRCIDHASESQRIQLVTEITYNSLTLVQDAFGNYVVQYVLDLNDNRFIEAIVRQFLGNVSALSAQKFSSNVVEKCIRVADATGRRAIIDELLNKQRLERLLRDSFANYVVQTALDYAEPAQRAQLIETIRPILPMIRNTPYGKRIQSKIQRETSDHMSRSSYNNNGPLVPGGMNGMYHNGMMNGGGQQQPNHFYNQQYQQPPHPHHQQQQQMMNGQMNGQMNGGGGQMNGGGGGFDRGFGGGNGMQQQHQYQQNYQQNQNQFPFNQQQQQGPNGMSMNGGSGGGNSNGGNNNPSMINNSNDYQQQQQQQSQQGGQSGGSNGYSPSPFM